MKDKDAKPDHELPGGSTPGGGPRPDHDLPGGRPDLPGRPGRPGGGEKPDQELPPPTEVVDPPPTEPTDPPVESAQ